MRFTPVQLDEMLRIIRKYVLEREVRIAKSPDQLSFMRMCNDMAKELERAMPAMSFDQIAALYVEMDGIVQGRVILGVDPQWSDFEPRDRSGLLELLGTLLGLKRMESGG